MLRSKLMRFVSRAALSVVVRLSFFVKRHAKSDWQKWANFELRNEPRGMDRPVSAAPEPFKQISSESRAQSGFPVDTRSQIEQSPRHAFESTRQIAKPIHLPEWAKEISPFLANQLSEHTRRAYETDLKHFFSFLEGRIDAQDLGQLRSEHIILFRKYLEEGRLHTRPLEKATINRKLAVVKSFLNWLVANDVMDDNPARLVKGFPQSQESALKGLSDEEVRKILEIPKRNTKAGALHQAILAVLLYLGLRKGELIGLKMGDVTEERGTPVLKVRGKGHRVRILPLSPLVKAALEHYFWVCGRSRSDHEAPLFLPTKNPRFGVFIKHLNPNAITYIVTHYAKKAGIMKRISPHSCRATCISNALDRKATHRSVQSLAGWSTPLMIQRYDKRREDLKNSAAFLVDYGSDEEGPQPAAPPPA